MLQICRYPKTSKHQRLRSFLDSISPEYDANILITQDFKTPKATTISGLQFTRICCKHADIPRLQYTKGYSDFWTPFYHAEYASNMRILKDCNGPTRPWLFIWRPQPFRNARTKNYNLYGTCTVTPSLNKRYFFKFWRARVCWPLRSLYAPNFEFLRDIWIRTQGAAAHAGALPT
jgi:hypothetical protein